MRIYFLLWHAVSLLCIGNVIQAYADEVNVTQVLTYDYSATTECLEEPWKAQYGGGILQNPEFEEDTQGWTVFGHGQIEQRTTSTGNKFFVALNRMQPSDSITQRIQLEETNLYAFSAWIQLSEGSEIVSVVISSPSGEKLYGGTTIATQGCWSMLKGGIVANFSGPADLTLESQTEATELWVDSVALQPFTKDEWRSHQDEHSNRKHKVRFYVTGSDHNTALEGATITFKQTKPGFPIGCEINQHILKNTNYQDWLASRFTVTAFGNEMKWYSTENVQGKEDYSIADAMLQLCENFNISVRGHNILWDNPRFNPSWVKSLSPQELKEAVVKRTESVVSRYKGRLIAWDVVNEDLHFSFYEDRLGQNITAEIYGMINQLDQTPRLFMNEYNTIEHSRDGFSIPAKYAKKWKSDLSNIQDLVGKKGNGYETLPMGIGLQSRFSPRQPNFAYTRAAMDYLGSIGFPLWLTEVYVSQGDGSQADCLEEVLREGYAHPAVGGIVIWPTSPFNSSLCETKMCLTDENFESNSETGDVVDNFIQEFVRSEEQLDVSSDKEGMSEAMLLDGDYEVTISHPSAKSNTTMKIRVDGNSSNIYHSSCSS